MTLVETAVEAEGVFQLCIKITNWISKINMEEKVETAPRRWLFRTYDSRASSWGSVKKQIVHTGCHVDVVAIS